MVATSLKVELAQGRLRRTTTKLYGTLRTSIVVLVVWSVSFRMWHSNTNTNRKLGQDVLPQHRKDPK